MAWVPGNDSSIGLSRKLRERAVVPGAGLFLLAFLLLVVYGPGFQGKWFLDDLDNIVQNPNIHAQALTADALAPAIFGKDPTRSEISRPVSYLSLAFNHALGGTDPLGYHLFNFLVHVLTATAVYLLARITLGLTGSGAARTGDGHAVALLGALLWAVHPIQVTAVTYIVQRMAALAALFSLVSMIGYVKGRTGRRARTKAFGFALCVLCGLLAIGCKENAVILPVSIYLYDRIFLAGSKKPNHMAVLVMAGLVVGAAAVFSTYYHVFDLIKEGYLRRPFTLSERLLTEPRVLFGYLGIMAYPVSARFTLLHDIDVSTGWFTPATTLPSLLLLAVLTFAAAAYRRKTPLLAYAWLFFLVNHLVESSVLPLELVFEHRNYLPSVFLFIAAAAGFARVLRFFAASRTIRSMAVTCAVVVLVCMGHTTHMRNSLFQDEIAFWADNVDKSPALHRPLHNLGAAFFSADQWPQGIAATRLSLEKKSLAQINQKYVSHFNLARFYFYAGEEDLALFHYTQTLRLLPNHAPSLNGMARIWLNRGDLQAADRYNALALRLAPGNSDLLATRGLIRMRQHRPRAAFRQGLAAWRKHPGNPTALFVLGEACRLLEKRRSAAFFFSRSLAQSPGTYAPLMALIEIAQTEGDRSEVCKLVGRLQQQFPPKKIGRLLAAYHRQYDFLGGGRIARITEAIASACRCFRLNHPVWAG